MTSDVERIGVPGRQVAGRLPTGAGAEPVRYLLFLPDAYGLDHHDHESGGEAGWPLMVFLHGAGERGDDLDLVKRHGPPMIVETTPAFPFVLVSPQCGHEQHWRPDRLLPLIDHVAANLSIDPSRIVLTGVSMGGRGVWDLAAAAPGRFAAIAPVCGWGEPALAPRLRHIPTWMFHGEKDPIVPIRGSTDMAAALRAAGGTHVRLTAYPDVEHDAWTAAYVTNELFDWLLRQRRAGGDDIENTEARR